LAGEADKSGAYSAGWEYLFDELKRLDMVINLQVVKQRHRQQDNVLDQFRGLVVTEEEIDDLLGEQVHIEEPDAVVVQTLTESLEMLEIRIQKRLATSISDGIYLSLHHLSGLFNLSPFEQQCIIICLAPELDRKYEKLYAYLQDDVTRKKPGVELVLNLLCSTAGEKLEVRRSFSHDAPLFKYRLLHFAGSIYDLTPLPTRFLKLDDRVVHFLLESRSIDARLESAARLLYPENPENRPEFHAVTGVTTDMTAATAAGDIPGRMIDFVHRHFNEEKNSGQKIVFYLYGYYGAGKHLLTEKVCYETGIPLIIADTGQLLDNPADFRERMWLLGRETLLQQAALCLENFDTLIDDTDKHRSHVKFIFEVCSTFSPMTFILGSQPWNPAGYLPDILFISQELPVPDDRARQILWENLYREFVDGSNSDIAGSTDNAGNGMDSNAGIAGSLDWGGLAGKFRFTPGQVRDAFNMAKSLASWSSPETGEITESIIHTACRGQSSQKLGSMARKIHPKYTWKDIILPGIQMQRLREVCSQVKNRHIVYGEWGFDRKLSLGKGLNVLFSGPPGTGKTMAAEVIANELDVDLYKIDLSQVVSKYIGETEKNLQAIFREAQFSNAILFFDEADALFGKRSEVKDAHDRYANIETAYLLQKMEEYDGITILATNLRNNMDEAFTRRLQFHVEFPFPNGEYREKIWQAMFPEEAPTSDEIDLPFLARKFNLTGGNIKNIVLTAAFLAAEKAGKIEMKHLVRAAKRELQKMGKLCMPEDFGEYYDLLD